MPSMPKEAVMYKQILTTLALILGMAAIGPLEAQAQMACGTRDSVVAKLGENYGEVRRGGGLAGPAANACL